MALPYPTNPATPSLPNPFFPDNGLVRGDQMRQNNTEIWANCNYLDGLLTTAISDISTLKSQVLAFGAERFPTYSNNVSDATNDIDMTFGRNVDTTFARMIVTAALTKQLDTAWAVGTGHGWLDEGTVTNATYHIYNILRSDTGVTDSLASLCNDNSGTFTVSIASPALVSWVDHGLQVGSAFVPTTTGALPTGMTAGTRYYVTQIITKDTFRFSTSQGGANVNTSGSQSGTHSATSQPKLPTNYDFRTKRLWSILRVSGSNRAFRQTGNRCRFLTPRLDQNGISLTLNVPSSLTVSVPYGVTTLGRFRFSESASVNLSLALSPVFGSDGSPSATASPLSQIGRATTTDANEVTVETTTNALINATSDNSITNAFYLCTLGWDDVLRGL